MRRWLAFVLLAGAFAFSFTAVQAQNPIKLSTLQVQLWPEYDQPSVLVIYDFKLPESAKLAGECFTELSKGRPSGGGGIPSAGWLAVDNGLHRSDTYGDIADRDSADPNGCNVSSGIL